MRRVTDLGLVEMAKDREVVAFVSTGTERESRIADQLARLTLKDATEIVELRTSDILDPEGTCLSFVRFPRLIRFRNGACDEDIVGFEPILEWASHIQ